MQYVSALIPSHYQVCKGKGKGKGKVIPLQARCGPEGG